MEALNYSSNIYEIWLPGLKGLIKMFRVNILLLISSDFFNKLINLCVAFNTIVLSLDGLVNNDEIL